MTLRKSALVVAAGVAAVFTVLTLRGIAPELYRYLRIRRM